MGIFYGPANHAGSPNLAQPPKSGIYGPVRIRLRRCHESFATKFGNY